jgi:hypothetical protein
VMTRHLLRVDSCKSFIKGNKQLNEHNNDLDCT